MIQQFQNGGLPETFFYTAKSTYAVTSGGEATYKDPFQGPFLSGPGVVKKRSLESFFLKKIRSKDRSFFEKNKSLDRIKQRSLDRFFLQKSSPWTKVQKL